MTSSCFQSAAGQNWKKKKKIKFTYPKWVPGKIALGGEGGWHDTEHIHRVPTGL